VTGQAPLRAPLAEVFAGLRLDLDRHRLGLGLVGRWPPGGCPCARLRADAAPLWPALEARCSWAHLDASTIPPRRSFFPDGRPPSLSGGAWRTIIMEGAYPANGSTAPVCTPGTWRRRWVTGDSCRRGDDGRKWQVSFRGLPHSRQGMMCRPYHGHNSLSGASLTKTERVPYARLHPTVRPSSRILCMR
jgi:hypothetical protein